MTGGTNAGGGGRLTAIVAVTYPEGSVCTVTNGTKTYKAKDTSGKALFSVEAGDWTVSCTDGESTASKSVTVEESAAINIELLYRFYVFKAGEGINSDFKFTNVGASSISTSSIIVNTNSTPSNYARFYISPAMDVSEYTTLNFELKATQYTGSDRNNIVAYGCSTNTTTSTVPSSSRFSACATKMPSSQSIISIDVSALTSAMYIKAETCDCRLTIYNIWYS